ncbi:MAG: DUF308 domain-containing protein [bacterium]
MTAIDLLYGRSRGTSAIIGAVAGVLGFVMMKWPGQISKCIISLLGIILLAIGAVGVVAAFISKHRARKTTFFLFLSMICIALGAAAIARPDLVAAMIVAFIGIMAMAYGIAGLYVLLRHPGRSRLSWIQGLLCIVAIALGIALFLRPLTAAATAIALAGLLIFILGIFSLIIAFSAKRLLS